MQKADLAGWIIAALVVLVLVSTFLTTASVTPSSAAGGGKSNKVSCANHSETKYVGVGQSRVYARVEVNMRACWRHAGLKVAPGKVLPGRSSFSVRFYNTGWGDTAGASWNMMEKYRVGGVYRNRWKLTKAQHIGFRSCVSIIGRTVCTPTADFILGTTFNSPYIADKSNHSDGSLPRWDFVWWHGEPGKKAGSYDDNVYLCDTMCR